MSDVDKRIYECVFKYDPPSQVLFRKSHGHPTENMNAAMLVVEKMGGWWR